MIFSGLKRNVSREGTGFFLLLAAPVIAVVLYGAVYPYAYSIVFLMIVAAALLSLPDLVHRDDAGRRVVCPVKTPLNVMIGLMGAYLVVQMTPMPHWMLGVVSPESLAVAKHAQSPAAAGVAPNEVWAAVAPYRFPVRQALVRWMVYSLFFFFLVQKLNTRRRVVVAILVIVITGSLDALYGIFENFSGRHHVLWVQKSSYVYIVTGTFINRNHFAGLMEVTTLLGIGYGLASVPNRVKSSRGTYFKRFMSRLLALEERLRRQGLTVFLVFVMVSGLIFSASRGAMIGIAAAFFFLGALFLVKRGYRRRGLFIFCFCLAALMVADSMGIEDSLERFESFGEDMEMRMRISRHTLLMFADYFWCGTGIGNFNHAYPRYQSSEDLNMSLIHAHNDWVQLLAEAGTVGFALFLVGLLMFLFRMARLLRHRHNTFAVCLGSAALAASLSIAIHEFSDFNLHIPAICLVLAATLAIGYAAMHIDGQGRRSPTNVPRHRLPLKGTGGGLLAVIALAAIWAGTWTVRHVTAEAFCSTFPDRSTRLGRRPGVDDALEAIAWDPANADYYEKLAGIRMRIRDENSAPPFGKGDRAAVPRYEPKAHRLIRQAAIVRDLEAAASRNPLDAWVHLKLGWEYYQMGMASPNMARWLSAADIAMTHAAYQAGEMSAYLYKEMGNYWVVRSKTLPLDGPPWETAWAKVRWNYQKALALEHRKLKQKMHLMIHAFIWEHYPDMTYIKDVLGEP